MCVHSRSQALAQWTRAEIEAYAKEMNFTLSERQLKLDTLEQFEYEDLELVE